MEDFPALSQWFEIVPVISKDYKYERYDLYFRDNSADRVDSFTDELALLIARLRLSSDEYTEWLRYWRNPETIPQSWRSRFRDAFWNSFVSALDDADKTIRFDEIGLQGYIGELMLYLIQFQYYSQRLDAAPRKPKPHAKDSGIDCLEICGDRDDYSSLHYIVWECKATTSDDPGSYPSKIYSQHLNEIGKSFREKVDFFDDIYAHDHQIGQFVKEMVDDFYCSTPTLRKRYGGCITLSATGMVAASAFAQFSTRFAEVLAEDHRCRQVRFCAVGSVLDIVKGVQRKIWSKLRP